MQPQPCFLYILKCYDHSYYIGRTHNLERRISEHRAGKVFYTTHKLPVEVVYVSECPDEQQAYNREMQIKGWSRAKKEALINESWEDLKKLANSKSITKT